MWGGGLLFLWLKRIEDLEKHVNADDVVSYIWYVVKYRLQDSVLY